MTNLTMKMLQMVFVQPNIYITCLRFFEKQDIVLVRSIYVYCLQFQLDLNFVALM